MKTNLIEKVKRMSTEYRFGDFFRNFIAVVLGIVITFAGSDLIEERKIRNEVKDALSLVKDEILLNRETIEELMEQELFEQRGACYLLQYKDSIDKASPDSIEKYGYSPFQSFNPIYIDDAMEMLKSSSLISAIENKKLATRIIQTYNTIKTAYGSFGAFMDIKLKCIEKLTDKAEVREALAKNKLRTKMQEWDFYFTIPEGVQAVLKYNERLEFLGDAVLSISVSDYIFNNCPQLPEGDLTKLRASLVCEKSLFVFAKKINLGKYIYLSNGERKGGGAERPSILSDAFEAVIAAIYLDGGMEKASEFVLSFVVPEIKNHTAGKN